MPAKKSAAKKPAAKKSTASKRKSTTAKKSPAKRSGSTKTRTTKKNTKSKAGDQEVTLDRRSASDRRDDISADTEAVANQPQLERREKVQRRRQIDPTTCERDYSDAEVEFMNAMDEYKRTSGRMFPTCSEVLEVIRDLGYIQLSPAEVAVVRPEDVEEISDTEAAVEATLENAEEAITEAIG